MENRITALQLQKKNPNRINVFLDGEYAFSLARIVAAWLETGQILPEEKIKRLISEDEVETAYQKAVKFISFRPRTTLEVHKKLSELNIAGEIVETVINRLTQKHYLDDRQYAEMWVVNRITHRPRSQRVIRMELKNKGIDEDIIVTTLAEKADDLTVARQAGLKYLPRIKQADSVQFTNKLGGYLARKGFNYGTIREILPELWEKYKINYMDTDHE